MATIIVHERQGLTHEFTRMVSSGINGAIGGAAAMGMGCLALRGQHDTYQDAGRATVAGLVGGAVIGGAAGLLVALQPPTTLVVVESDATAEANPRNTVALVVNGGTSVAVNTGLPALLGGMVGSAILTAAHHPGQLPLGNSVVAALVGEGIWLAAGLGVVVCVAGAALCCCCAFNRR